MHQYLSIEVVPHNVALLSQDLDADGVWARMQRSVGFDLQVGAAIRRFDALCSSAGQFLAIVEERSLLADGVVCREIGNDRYADDRARSEVDSRHRGTDDDFVVTGRERRDRDQKQDCRGPS